MEFTSMTANFFNLSLSDLTTFLAEKGHKRYRAQQLYRWVYKSSVTDPEKMTNLSKNFRTELSELFCFQTPQLVKHLKSADGTEKLIFKTQENFEFESILIPSKNRMTLCLSSEVGCNMGCKFCYTGKQKLKKRLSTFEIVGQYITAQKFLKSHSKITNLVFMGMGEPLDNEQAVFTSIDIFHEPLGINLSKKRITVSTSGIVDRIEKVTQSKVRLAVSLNGVDDHVRTSLMPINRKWPLQELLKACKKHTQEAKEKVTFEYVLLKGVTDSTNDARRLYHLTKAIPCKINIIPFNEHPQSGFLRPEEDRIVNFQNTLIQLGAHVLRRKTMGDDILAACGQLNPQKGDLQ